MNRRAQEMSMQTIVVIIILLIVLIAIVATIFVFAPEESLTYFESLILVPVGILGVSMLGSMMFRMEKRQSAKSEVMEN